MDVPRRIIKLFSWIESWHFRTALQLIFSPLKTNTSWNFFFSFFSLIKFFFFFFNVDYLKNLYWNFHNIASIFFWLSGSEACRILVPWPRIPWPPTLEGEDWNTELPGKSLPGTIFCLFVFCLFVCFLFFSAFQGCLPDIS